MGSRPSPAPGGCSFELIEATARTWAAATRTAKISTPLTFTSDSRSFPAGSYTYFVSYEADNVWHSLTPVDSFTVGDTSPTSSPTPTPVPTTSTPTTAPTMPGAPVPTGVPGTWSKLLLDDEFDGSSLNTSHWSTGWGAVPGITPPVNSEESDCYDPNQVAVSGGTLHLTLVQKTETCAGKNRALRLRPHQHREQVQLPLRSARGTGLHPRRRRTDRELAGVLGRRTELAHGR